MKIEETLSDRNSAVIQKLQTEVDKSAKLVAKIDPTTPSATADYANQVAENDELYNSGRGSSGQSQRKSTTSLDQQVQ